MRLPNRQENFGDVFGQMYGGKFKNVTFILTKQCQLRCFPAGTQILMHDMTYKNIEDVDVGEYVMATEEHKFPDGQCRSLFPTKVTRKYQKKSKTVRIETDSSTVTTTAEHLFLCSRNNWVPAENLSFSENSKVRMVPHIPEYIPADISSDDYMVGYLVAAWLGDGCIYHGIDKNGHAVYNCRFVVKDDEMNQRVRSYMKHFGFDIGGSRFKISQKNNIYRDSITVCGKPKYEALTNLIYSHYMIDESRDYLCGFLAGIIDAEGAVTKKYIRIFNSDDNIIREIIRSLDCLGIGYSFDKEKPGTNKPVKTLRVSMDGNVMNNVALLLTIQNAIPRKRYEWYYGSKKIAKEQVKNIINNDDIVDVYDLETEAHTYTANNFIVHNCSYCFPAGTMIDLDRNMQMRIEDIQVGDRVLGFPEEIAEQVSDKDFSIYQNTCRTLVTAVMDRVYSGKMVKLFLENRNMLHMTADHPVLCGRGFVPAEEIKVTDYVFDNLGRHINVSATEYYHADDLHVYNLETDLHTYFAEDTLVHNCYEEHKCGDRMSFDTARRFVDLLFDMDARGDKYVNEDEANGLCLDFIGGEPLLEVELMDQICDYFVLEALRRNHRWATRYMISISTNGVAYFEPAVQHFFKKWGNKVSVGITIDGNKELHDKCRRFADGRPSYDLAAAAFKDAIRRYGYDGTKLTIARANLPYLATAFKDMINEFGISFIQGNPVFEEEWTNEDAGLYYRQIKEVADWLLEDDRWQRIGTSFLDQWIGHALPENENSNWCGGANGRMLAVDTDGKIYPCVRYAPVSIGEKAAGACVGDVDHGLLATQQQCDFAHCLDCITRRSASTDECWHCPIASGCASCNAWQFDRYGDANHRCTNICPMHKARVMASAYYYNRLAALTGDNSLHFDLNIPPEWAIPIVGEAEYKMLRATSE